MTNSGRRRRRVHPWTRRNRRAFPPVVPSTDAEGYCDDSGNQPCEQNQKKGPGNRAPITADTGCPDPNEVPRLPWNKWSRKRRY